MIGYLVYWSSKVRFEDSLSCRQGRRHQRDFRRHQSLCHSLMTSPKPPLPWHHYLHHLSRRCRPIQRC